jgi:hypothetical protein
MTLPLQKLVGESTSRNIAWGPWAVVVAGGLLFLVGAGRFVHRQHFGFSDALYCCAAEILKTN